MKNSTYYIAPVGVRTHDLPHTVASNMGKVSYALAHSATNKSLLASILCGYPLQNNVLLVDKRDCLVTHEEADITFCSYMLEAAASSAETIMIVCDDTDVFFLLVYWTWRTTIRKNTQMEKWDRTVLDIRATVDTLGDKCGQLPSMYALSGGDTLTYHCGKGKQSALKVLMNNDTNGIQDALGKPDISQGQLKVTAGAFLLALYGQKKTDSLNTTRYKMYMSRKKPPPLKKLPPTDSNLQLHVLRAHLQMMHRKAADQMHPPVDARDIRRFGWDVKEDGVVTTYVSYAPVAPHGLLDVVSCSCSAQRKACSEKRCSCHSVGLSCTEYCYCEEGDACCGPYNKHTEEDQLADDMLEDERERLTMMNR